MYKVGEFSKIVDLSSRTLRFWDESGVLNPSEKDNFTGYKYYSKEDVIECEFVKLLKSLDFTLNEIIKFRDSSNIDIINDKKIEIKNKIELLNKKYELLTLLNQLLEENNSKEEINKKIDGPVKVYKYERRNYKSN